MARTARQKGARSRPGNFLEVQAALSRNPQRQKEMVSPTYNLWNAEVSDVVDDLVHQDVIRFDCGHRDLDVSGDKLII